jgi:5-formyltetrahydrofolate cyclo-ligase
MHDKKQLRDTMLKKRMALPAVQSAQLAQAAARHFADHPILAFAKSCAGYVAMRGEMDVLPILAFMQRFDRPTAIPRTLGAAPLVFHEWKADEALDTHTLGMKEPQAHAKEITPEIILTPLLAFDSTGNRLGYGGGQYDRTMEKLRAEANPPLFIGVGYSWQEVSAIPVEDHDTKLDGILTELGVSLFT